MSKKNAVLLENQEDLVIVLRRMTTREIYGMYKESGEHDLRDFEQNFRFTATAIAAEIGGCSKNVSKVIQESDLEYVYQGSSLFVWLDDLDERLEKFFKSHDN